MNVKYTYDEKTEENLEKFRSALSEYEELLKKKIDERGLYDIDARNAFLHDSGRISILNQMTKIHSLAVPVSIEFTGADYKMLIGEGK